MSTAATKPPWRCSRQCGDVVTSSLTILLAGLFAFALIIQSQGQTARDQLPASPLEGPKQVGAFVRRPGLSGETLLVRDKNIECSPTRTYTTTTVRNPEDAFTAASHAASLLPSNTCNTSFTLAPTAPLVGAGTAASPLTLDKAGMTGGELLVFDQSLAGAWSRERVACSLTLETTLLEGAGTTASPVKLITTGTAGSTLLSDGSKWTLSAPLTGGAVTANGAFFSGDGSTNSGADRVTLLQLGATDTQTLQYDGVTLVPHTTKGVSGGEGAPYHYVTEPASLQAKIDAAFAAGGGIVKIMRDLELTTVITMRPLVVLEGHYSTGGRDVKLTKTGALPMFVFAAEALYHGYNAAYDWQNGQQPGFGQNVFRRLRFDTSASSAGSAPVGVIETRDLAQRWIDIRVERCHFRLAGAHHAAVFWRYQAPAATTTQPTTQDGFFFTRNTVEAAGANAAGVHMQAYAAGVHVSDNDFRFAAATGVAARFWGETRGALFSRNFVTGGTGVDVAGAKALVVRANHFTGTACGVRVRQATATVEGLGTAHTRLHSAATSISTNIFTGCVTCVTIGEGATSMTEGSGGHPLGVVVDSCLFKHFTGVAVEVLAAASVNVGQSTFIGGASAATTAVGVRLTKARVFSLGMSLFMDLGTVLHDVSAAASDVDGGNIVTDVTANRVQHGLLLNSPRWSVMQVSIEHARDGLSLGARSERCFVRVSRFRGTDGDNAVCVRNAGAKNVLTTSALLTKDAASAVVREASAVGGRESVVGVNSGTVTSLRANALF